MGHGIRRALHEEVIFGAMAGPADISISTHDDHPKKEAGVVDHGLDEFNFAVAPLHEVTPLSCFARLPGGEVIGGAVGRSWGPCAEIQQLWVSEAHRKSGIGTRLVYAFENHARGRGWQVEELHVEPGRLDEVFRTITGSGAGNSKEGR